MSTQTQPALAWHRELAEDIRNHFAKSWPHDGTPDPLLAIIANRCPHQAQNATTVRLLEEAERKLCYAMKGVLSERAIEDGRRSESGAPGVDWPGNTEYDDILALIRAHLAALKQGTK